MLPQYHNTVCCPGDICYRFTRNPIQKSSSFFFLLNSFFTVPNLNTILVLNLSYFQTRDSHRVTSREVSTETWSASLADSRANATQNRGRPWFSLGLNHLSPHCEITMGRLGLLLEPVGTYFLIFLIIRNPSMVFPNTTCFPSSQPHAEHVIKQTNKNPAAVCPGLPLCCLSDAMRIAWVACFRISELSRSAMLPLWGWTKTLWSWEPKQISPLFLSDTLHRWHKSIHELPGLTLNGWWLSTLISQSGYLSIQLMSIYSCLCLRGRISTEQQHPADECVGCSALELSWVNFLLSESLLCSKEAKKSAGDNLHKPSGSVCHGMPRN